MVITVTQEHIDKGVRGSCSSDPVSLALKDAGFYRPWVSPNGIKVVGFQKDFKHRSFDPPYGVLQFVLDFDGGKTVLPFEFELEM